MKKCRTCDRELDKRAKTDYCQKHRPLAVHKHKCRHCGKTFYRVGVNGHAKFRKYCSPQCNVYKNRRFDDILPSMLDKAANMARYDLGTNQREISDEVIRLYVKYIECKQEAEPYVGKILITRK